MTPSSTFSVYSTRGRWNFYQKNFSWFLQVAKKWNRVTFFLWNFGLRIFSQFSPYKNDSNALRIWRFLKQFSYESVYWITFLMSGDLGKRTHEGNFWTPGLSTLTVDYQSLKWSAIKRLRRIRNFRNYLKLEYIQAFRGGTVYWPRCRSILEE